MKAKILILCATVLAGCASKPAESPSDVGSRTATPDDGSMTGRPSTSGMTPTSTSGTSMTPTSGTTAGATGAGNNNSGSSAGKGMTGNGATSTSDGRTMPADNAPASGGATGPGATGTATGSAMQPDNTGVNKRDASGAPLTAGDQSNAKSDVDITAAIRKAIVGDSAMSTTAKNVKIITIKGKVTLRGPVKSDDERAKIEAAAKRVAGDGQVDNQLEVKTK